MPDGSGLLWAEWVIIAQHSVDDTVDLKYVGHTHLASNARWADHTRHGNTTDSAVVAVKHLESTQLLKDIRIVS